MCGVRGLSLSSDNKEKKRLYMSLTMHIPITTYSWLRADAVPFKNIRLIYRDNVIMQS